MTATQTLFHDANRTGTHDEGSALRRGLLAAGVLTAGLMASTAAAQAAPIVQCVPTTAGQPVLSGSALSACPANTRKLTLPASEAAQQTLNDILPYLSFRPAGIGGKPTITVRGANLQIVSGSGSTDAAVNGAGNLVVGYNEAPGIQTGSHNLLLGTSQEFTSFGAIVGGSHNRAAGSYSTVLGYQNTASGTRTTVSGGSRNTAAGTSSAIGGGYANRADSPYSAIVGGCENRTSATTQATGDERFCGAQDAFQSILGGHSNSAMGLFSSIGGGWKNITSKGGASVSGGSNNLANGPLSSVAGGAFRTVNNSFATYPAGP